MSFVVSVVAVNILVAAIIVIVVVAIVIVAVVVIVIVLVLTLILLISSFNDAVLDIGLPVAMLSLTVTIRKLYLEVS